MARTQILSDERIHGLDKFVGKVLEAYKAGKVEKQAAVWDIGHVIVAIDQGNETEVVSFPANWRPPSVHDAVEKFLSAIEESGLRISSFDAFRAALLAADDWRDAAVHQALQGRKTGVVFFFATPGVPTVEVMLRLVELLDQHGFDAAKRRAIIQNVTVSASRA